MSAGIGIAIGLGAVAGFAGTVATPKSTPGDQGLDRSEMGGLTIGGGLIGTIGLGAIGTMTDTPGFIYAAAGAMGVIGGGVLGQIAAGVMDARNAAG